MKGKYYVFEGIDGAGKTSVIRALKKLFNADGYHVAVAAELDDDVGKVIRKMVTSNNKDTFIRGLFASNYVRFYINYVKLMKSSGLILLGDRSFLSNMAYAANDESYLESCKFLNHFFKYNSFPDQLFYLDIDPKEAHKRLKDRTNSKDDLVQPVDKLSHYQRAYERAIEDIRRFKIEDKLVVNRVNVNNLNQQQVAWKLYGQLLADIKKG